MWIYSKHVILLVCLIASSSSASSNVVDVSENKEGMIRRGASASLEKNTIDFAMGRRKSSSAATSTATLTGTSFDEFADFPLENNEKNFQQQQQQQERHQQQHADRILQSSTETERVNIFQQLKESIGLAIVGILLICCMPVLIWKNEGRHVRELQRIDFCKNEAIAIDSNKPGEDTLGRLVYFTGEVTVGDEKLDFSSGMIAGENSTGGLNLCNPVNKAIVVKRTCYIYQKFEDSQQTVEQDRLGGGQTRTTTYTLREDWTALGPQPETLPHLTEETNSRGIWDKLVAAAGETNESGVSSIIPNLPNDMAEKLFGLHDPTQAPHGLKVSPAARIGGFALSRDIIVENSSVFLKELESVPAFFLPDYVPGCEELMKGSDNVLRTFPEGQEPQNGDCKVVYEYVLDGFDCSCIVLQTSKADPETGAQYGVDKADVINNKCFGKCNGDGLGVIWMVRRGIHDLGEMIDMATEDENNVTKTIRMIAWILLLAGWVMLFTPFTTALQVLPILARVGNFAVVLVALIVSLLCCGTVTILAYIRYRPLLGTALLLVAGGIWGFVAWRLSIAVEEGGEVTDDIVP